MRIHHGWTLNGPLRIRNMPQSVITSHRILVREVELVKEVFLPQLSCSEYV